MPESTQNFEFAKPSTMVEEASTTMEEVQVLLVPIIEGTSKEAEAAREELVIIIFPVGTYVARGLGPSRVCSRMLN